jgi:hypothetical protein
MTEKHPQMTCQSLRYGTVIIVRRDALQEYNCTGHVVSFFSITDLPFCHVSSVICKDEFSPSPDSRHFPGFLTPFWCDASLSLVMKDWRIKGIECPTLFPGLNPLKIVVCESYCTRYRPNSGHYDRHAVAFAHEQHSFKESPANSEPSIQLPILWFNGIRSLILIFWVPK